MEETARTLTRETAIPLYEAIEHRHSHRAYTGEPLPQDRKQKLVQFLEDGWEPYPGARTRAVLIEGVDKTAKIFKGFVGSYGSVKDAPALIAMIGQTDDPYFYEATGYMG
ncbi:MAG TPA: nitroreductase family protein, partial [Bacilli bacterium]|nr:nitroreductase family protein [Bacilli bacterium]